jgi:hypothetical protein
MPQLLVRDVPQDVVEALNGEPPNTAAAQKPSIVSSSKKPCGPAVPVFGSVPKRAAVS